MVKKGQQFPINGWRIADCDEPVFSLTVNGQTIPVKDSDRPDVISVYEEEYAGYIEDTKPGFNAVYTAGAEGSLEIKGTITTGGKQIAEKSITVTVE